MAPAGALGRQVDNQYPSEDEALPSNAVRSAHASDGEAIADLLGQLGYPTTPGEAEARLARLQEHGHAIAIVAEVQGRVAGLVTAHSFPSIHDTPPVAWLTTLVVDAVHANRGVGRQLCAAAEEWAAQRGAVRISVSSGTHRDEAHAFYERIGYQRTGLRLTKTIHVQPPAT